MDDLNEHEIIKTYIPYVVKRVMRSAELPQNEEELIEFSQALGKQIIKRIEPVKMN